MAIFPLPSLGSRNDWNDLAHFKASSLPPQIFSSHVWFIPPFLALAFSLQHCTKKTQMVNQWTSRETLIFQTLRYSFCHLQPTSRFCLYTHLINTSISSSIFSPVITQLTVTTWARTLWGGSCTYQTPTPGGFTGPECWPVKWILRQTWKL